MFAQIVTLYSVGEIFRYALKTHDNVPGRYRDFTAESENENHANGSNFVFYIFRF